MKPSYRFYRGCYRLARAAIGIFYRLRVVGRENIPEGAAMVCGNHSSLSDPFLVAFAFGVDHHMHFVAKVELFRLPVIAPILRKLGMISVNRDIQDTASIKSMLGYLKKDEKVAIFPEGTRASKDGEVSAKSGAVKIADRARVPLVPVFLPRKKPLFTRVPVIIGEPYYPSSGEGRLAADDYARLAEELMDRIYALDPSQTDLDSSQTDLDSSQTQREDTE